MPQQKEAELGYMFFHVKEDFLLRNMVSEGLFLSSAPVMSLIFNTFARQAMFLSDQK